MSANKPIIAAPNNDKLIVFVILIQNESYVAKITSPVLYVSTFKIVPLEGKIKG